MCTHSRSKQLPVTRRHRRNCWTNRRSQHGDRPKVVEIGKRSLHPYFPGFNAVETRVRPPFRPRPLLRPARLSADCRGARKARLAAHGVLAAWRPSLLPACRSRSPARRPEVNPLCFQPFGGYGDDTIISEGVATPPQIPGIAFEARQSLRDLLATLLDV